MIRSLLLLAALLVGSAHTVHSAEGRTCVPGQPVTLQGEAPANVAVLVRWDGRTVGGATAQADGRYTLVLRVGAEAPGRHVVTVVERSNGQELRRLLCDVPQGGTEEAVPTPTLAAAGVDEAPTPAAAAPTPPADPPAPGPESMSAPTPAPTDAPAPEPAEPQPNVPQRVVQGQAPSGWAQLTTEAALAIAVPPRSEADVLRSYPAGTRVKLLGQSYRRWVSVQPQGAAAIGWMDAASLQMLTGTPGPESTTTPGPEPADAAPALPATGVLTPAAVLTTTSALTPTASPTPPSTARQARPISVELLAPTPSSSPTPAPVARTVTVSVCRTRSASTTASCTAPVGGTRVELLLAATDELLASGATGTDGTATLAVSVPAGAGLRLRLPAIGVAGPLAERDQVVTVALPPALLLNGGAQ